MQLDARCAPEGDAATLRADGYAEGRVVGRAQVAVEAAGAGFDGDAVGGGVGGGVPGWGGVGGCGGDGGVEGAAAGVEVVFVRAAVGPAAGAGLAEDGGDVVVGAVVAVVGRRRKGARRVVLF